MLLGILGILNTNYFPPHTDGPVLLLTYKVCNYNFINVLILIISAMVLFTLQNLISLYLEITSSKFHLNSFAHSDLFAQTKNL